MLASQRPDAIMIDQVAKPVADMGRTRIRHGGEATVQTRHRSYIQMPRITRIPIQAICSPKSPFAIPAFIQSNLPGKGGMLSRTLAACLHS